MSQVSLFDIIEMEQELRHRNAVAADYTIRNLDQDKDIIIEANDGGTMRTAIQVNGDEGSVTMPRQSYVMAYRSSAQTIATGTHTTVIFNAETVDTLGEYNTSTGIFTAKDAGVYVITTSIHWANTNAGKSYLTSIIAGGNKAGHHVLNSATTFSQYPASVSGSAKLTAGQTIYISVWQDSGGNEDLLWYSNDYLRLTITKVS